MQENDSIEISAAENGFIVSRPRHDGMEIMSFMVFRSMNELQTFLADHFTHRGKCLESDS